VPFLHVEGRRGGRWHVWHGRRGHACGHAAAPGMVWVLARLALRSAVEKRRDESRQGEPAEKKTYGLLICLIGSYSGLLADGPRIPTMLAQWPNWLPLPRACSCAGCSTLLGCSTRRRRRRRSSRRWRTSRTCWARLASPAAGRLRGSASHSPRSRSSPSAGRPGSRRRRPSPRPGSLARR
jgi:hypothetical protein